jgi:class 3 adenylate cyclase
VTEQQVLEEAIATLRKHRSVLGDSVVETAVAALQDQINLSGTSPLIKQFESVTVLQADISGFTAMSAKMDAEQVRDAINALWERLDNVVLSWGGQIEQHTGDGLIALFGVPLAHEDDAQRAILAALDMQLELALYNEAALEPTDTSPLGRSEQRTDFRMRIGIHSGPLLWGRVGQSLGQTAVGDTVQIVGQIEKLCPVDDVLISYDVYRQVFGMVEVESGPLLRLPESDDDLPVYIVKGEKARAFQVASQGVHGIKSRFVGRINELERLEHALQETLDHGVMQVVTVTGEVGIGKSRLVDEFERWLEMMPVRGCVMRAHCTRSGHEMPYETFRQLFMDYFEIHQRSTLPVVLEKFVRGVARSAGSHDINTQEQAHVMGQLLGFDFSNSPYVKNLQEEPQKLVDYGLQDLARFFTDLSRQLMPIVILLENAQWADEASLNAIDYLLEACYDLPILVVCLARPDMLAERPLWDANDDPLSPYLTVPMPPLSAIDSRHMVADIITSVKHIPFKLSDLIVFSAQGNPYFLEQLIYYLYEVGVMPRQEGNNQVNLGKLDELDVPTSLSELFLARVDLLPYEEKQVLAAAAVFGRVFWDDAIIDLLKRDFEFTTTSMQQALSHLEQKEMIFRQRSSMVTGTSEFSFVHDLLQDAVYEHVALPMRKLYHIRYAEWLKLRSKTHHLSFYNRMIVEHEQKAGRAKTAVSNEGSA